jgi:hypothetical protein
MRSLIACMSLVALAGCGAEAPSDPVVGKTTDQLCSAAPIDNGDGTATMVGCSYEMHVYNITHHGAATPAIARGADGTALSVSHSCGRYLLGKDPTGVGVIIDRTTGDVQSHGSVHAGQATASLTTLRLPIAVE